MTVDFCPFLLYTIEFGKAFEHFIVLELRSYLSYRRIKKDLTFWRTQTDLEVDFLMGSDTAIEEKSTEKVTDKMLKGLRALKEENIVKNFFLVSFDEIEREPTDGIRILHWKSLLEKLWRDEVVG